MAGKFYTCLLVLLLAPQAFASNEYELWKTARRAWYKNDWKTAAENYQELVDKFPDSPRRCKSENFLGYCFKNMGELQKAFDQFAKTVERGKCPEENEVDARSEMVRLAYELIDKDPSYKKFLLQSLNDQNKLVRFLAALMVSQSGDDAGMEVFFQVLETEDDQDLRDTAINHILKLGKDKDKERLDELLAQHKQENKGKKAKMVRLIIRDLKTKEPETRVNLPIGLFNVVLEMLDDDQRELIKKEAGVDLGSFTSFKLEEMPPGTVIFKIVDGSNKEIKLFLE